MPDTPHYPYYPRKSPPDTQGDLWRARRDQGATQAVSRPVAAAAYAPVETAGRHTNYAAMSQDPRRDPQFSGQSRQGPFAPRASYTETAANGPPSGGRPGLPPRPEPARLLETRVEIIRQRGGFLAAFWGCFFALILFVGIVAGAWVANQHYRWVDIEQVLRLKK